MPTLSLYILTAVLNTSSSDIEGLGFFILHYIILCLEIADSLDYYVYIFYYILCQHDSEELRLFITIVIDCITIVLLYCSCFLCAILALHLYKHNWEVIFKSCGCS